MLSNQSGLNREVVLLERSWIMDAVQPVYSDYLWVLSKWSEQRDGLIREVMKLVYSDHLWVQSKWRWSY